MLLTAVLWKPVLKLYQIDYINKSLKSSDELCVCYNITDMSSDFPVEMIVTKEELSSVANVQSKDI